MSVIKSFARISKENVYRGNLCLNGAVCARDALFIKKDDEYIFVGDYSKSGKSRFTASEVVPQPVDKKLISLRDLKWMNAVFICVTEGYEEVLDPYIGRYRELFLELMKREEETRYK